VAERGPRVLLFSKQTPNTPTMNQTNNTNAAVAVYNSHGDAEACVQELQKSGFDMKKLSIVGRDYHTDEHVVGY
jgi:hypothetical protein